MRRTRKLLGALLALALCLTLLPAPAGAAEVTGTVTPNTWVLNGGYWYYYTDDGTLAKDENVCIDHSSDWSNYAWYSFDEEGRLRQDEVFENPEADGELCYAFPGGALATSQWVRLSGDFSDPSSLKLYEPGDTSSYGWYYFFTGDIDSSPGTMLRDQYRLIEGAIYAFDENRKMYTDTWLTVDEINRGSPTSAGTILGTAANPDDPNDLWGQAAHMTYYGGNGQRVTNMTLPLGEDHLDIWYTFDSSGKVTQVTAGSGTNAATGDYFPDNYDGKIVINDENLFAVSERVPVKRVQSVTATPAEGGTGISYTPGDTLNLTFTVKVYSDNTTTSNINHDSYLFWVEAYGVDSPARLTAPQLQVKSEGESSLVATATFTYTPTSLQEETVTLYVNGVGDSYTLTPRAGSAGDAENLEKLVNSILPNEMVVNGDSTTSTAAREMLDAILTAADDAKKAELQDTMAGRLSYEATDTQYALENNIAVSTSVADNAASYFTASKVEMVGGALNAEKGQPVELQVSAPNPASDLTEYAHEFSFDLSLLVNGEKQSNLVFPVKVTLPVPTGYDIDDVVLFHQEQDGTLAAVDIKKDTETGTVTFTTTSFSTYIFAQGSAPDIPDDDPQPGGLSVSTYAIAVESSGNGTVRASASRAAAGSRVSLTVNPNEGYVLDTLTVTGADGSALTLTETATGYTFTMPASAVTVTATFEEINHADTCPSGHFNDVDLNSWYHEALDYVIENGLMVGTSDTTFEPEAAMSRAQLVTILWRLAGEPVADDGMNFEDVAAGEWYAEAVRWAASEGIVLGTSETTYSPGDPVSREQLAAILYRYAVYQGYDVSIGEDTNILSYTDFDQLSEWAIPAMQWACGAGIIQGTSESTLTPQGDAARAQVAAMLQRFCTLTAAE